jgi:hypothetical protein
MEFTYDNIEKFMEEYFKTYNEYGQDAKTIHRLDKYYTPDISEYTFEDIGVNPNELTRRLPRPSFFTGGREGLYKLSLNNRGIRNNLTSINMIIDVRQHEVHTTLKAVVTDAKTGEVKIEVVFDVIYGLALDEKKTIKIAKIGDFHYNGTETAVMDYLWSNEKYPFTYPPRKYMKLDH